MLNIVQNYVLHADFNEADRLKRFLNSAFENDIFKRFENKKEIKVLDRYENISNQLKNKDLRFHIREFSKNPSRDRILDDFVWLRKAGVAIPVYRSSSFEHRLRMSSERSVLKLLMDVEMLTTSIRDPSLQKKLSMREEEANTRAIIENFVAQELSAHGLKDLYFYRNKKLGEVDFPVEKGGMISFPSK